ncbi:MAG: hypothetical protein ACK4VO_11630 [Pseudobdellovibrio sp.]
MLKNFNFVFLLSITSLFISVFAYAQTPATPAPPATSSTTSNSKDQYDFEEVEEAGGNSIKLLLAEGNKKRIRRYLNLISGIKHDEEISLPEVPLTYKGAIELIDIQRIKGTDIFRILPLSKPGAGTTAANGIITIHNKKTGQILAEVHIEIRDQNISKQLREIQALLADIEGIEYKIVNNKIVLDGFVLFTKDLKRISNVMAQYDPASVSSLVTLSPIARKKIVEYIEREVNNPEVTITAVGDFIKLEGFVNSNEEKSRIANIAMLYLPEMVQEKSDAIKNLSIIEKRPSAKFEDYIINNIQVRKSEEKNEPPPKMIQFVMHIVEYNERYLKNFSFVFSPSLTSLDVGAQQNRAPGSISEIAGIVNNLLPKLNWARKHGFTRLLDTASILVQDKAKTALINRSVTVANVAPSTTPGQQPQQTTQTTYQVSMTIKNPAIKAERSGLIYFELAANSKSDGSQTPVTNVETTVTVRDRQSAALAGVISKKSENQYGGPPTGVGPIITLNHGKEFTKNSSNYVLFITPIIKSNASSGVEQVKKKFRMKE